MIEGNKFLYILSNLSSLKSRLFIDQCCQGPSWLADSGVYICYDKYVDWHSVISGVVHAEQEKICAIAWGETPHIHALPEL